MAQKEIKHLPLSLVLVAAPCGPIVCSELSHCLLCFQIVNQYDNVILRYSIKLLFRRLYKAFLHELAFSVCISLNEGNIGVLSSKMGDDVD